MAAARRPARSLNTIRDLAVGDGSYGAFTVAALAGLVGILYFKKNSDDSAGEETRKEVPDKKPVNEPVSDVRNSTAIKPDSDVGNLKEVGVNASFRNNGSNFSLENYLAEMTEVVAAQKIARQKREVSHKSVNKVAKIELDKEEEAAMKARFELDEGIWPDIQK